MSKSSGEYLHFAAKFHTIPVVHGAISKIWGTLDNFLCYERDLVILSLQPFCLVCGTVLPELTFSVLGSIKQIAVPQGFDSMLILVERLRRPQHSLTHMEAQQPHAVHENGDTAPKIAIKGADGGAVQSDIAAKTQPSEPPMETPFKKSSMNATTEVHSTTGPAIPAGNMEARSQEEAKVKSQKPWAKGMTDTAMHTPMQVIPTRLCSPVCARYYCSTAVFLNQYHQCCSQKLQLAMVSVTVDCQGKQTRQSRTSVTRIPAE